MSEMTFGSFSTRQHYEDIASWWRAQNWPEVPLSHLPPVGFGAIISSKPVCAGFLYINGTALSNFEWIVASPELRREKRTEALNLLFEGIKGAARQAGVESIFLSTRHQSLITRLEKHGFQQTDLNMTNMIARV